MRNTSINRYKEIKIIVLYIISFASIIVLIKLLFYPDLLKVQNFLNWDAEHYYWIKNNGYEGFRVAFFPLFPLIWKALSFGVYGIVIANLIIFLTAFYLLIKSMELKDFEIILYLSIPSFCFFFLPYTESIFFATSTLLLLGLKRNRNGFIVIGLFLSALARPAFIFFIPAIIITELVSEQLNYKAYLRILIYSLVSLLGLLIVFGIHFYYTGNWFEYYEVSKGWGGILQFPRLPFTSWSGGLIVRLDGAAMLIGTSAGIILTAYLLKAKFIRHISMPKEVVFSLCYLGGITSFIILRGGSLFSLNRFVFAVPFIIVAANFFFNLKLTLDKKRMLLGFLIIFMFYLLFGSYVHIQTLLKFLFLSFYLFLILGIKSKNQIISRISIFLLIGFNVFFQVFFYIRFLNGGWIG